MRNYTSESCLSATRPPPLHVRRERLTHRHLENNVTQLRVHGFLHPSPKIYLQGKSESELRPVILDSLKVFYSWPKITRSIMPRSSTHLPFPSIWPLALAPFTTTPNPPSEKQHRQRVPSEGASPRGRGSGAGRESAAATGHFGSVAPLPPQDTRPVPL